MKNKKLREQVKSYIIVTLACVLYALSFDWFYAPNGFTVGGFTGISQIINFFAPILPVGTMVIVLNVPLFIVGLKKFGFAFLCKSIYTMTLSSILIDVVAAIHEFAPMDPLLACLYGGVTSPRACCSARRRRRAARSSARGSCGRTLNGCQSATSASAST